MKNLVIVLLSLVIVGGGFIAYSLINGSMDDVAKLECEIAELNDELSDVTDEYNELSEQVYNEKTGEAYEITIKHNDEVHTWKSEGGLFSSEMHNVVY